jgi:hypothetical protein
MPFVQRVTLEPFSPRLMAVTLRFYAQVDIKTEIGQLQIMKIFDSLEAAAQDEADLHAHSQSRTGG